MIRLGLCCKFHEAPVAFKSTTVAALSKCGPTERAAKLAALARANVQALRRALEFCAAHGIGCFRVNSQILPVKTHPATAYVLAELPGGEALVSAFQACGAFARQHRLRLAFHPDQFILLSSPDPEINRQSVADLQYQAEVAEWVGADVLNIHAGGAYGDKRAALKRLAAALCTLPKPIRTRLTLENDDRVYTPADLLPICRDTGTPFVYDVHHHRCLPDGLSVAEVTRQALTTWGTREPLFHVSSPKEGRGAGNPRPHHDFIDPADFPREWRGLDITVEVEAKAKEVAVARLRQALLREGVALWPEGAGRNRKGVPRVGGTASVPSAEPQ